MRIKKESQAAYQLGILGKVKVGEISANGYPTSLDYFRFTSNNESRVARMQERFGEKPTKLPITFHSDDTNIVCVQKYELRDDAGKLVAYGDGQTFFESHKDGFVQKPTMDTKQGEKYMEALRNTVAEKAKKPDKIKWNETLTLRFWVMGYDELGLWEFSTKGKDTSIGQIIASFDTVMQQAGRVRGIPFWLEVEKHKSNRANANRQYPVVNLVCDLSPEMVERVGLIGSNIGGFLVTPEKISGALPMPEKAAAVQVENDIEDAEIVEDTLLDDLSKPVEQYNVTMIVEAPQLPNMDGITPLPTEQKPIVKEAVEKLELEHEYTSNLMPQDRYEKLCCYVISGHANGMEVSSQWVSETLIKQGLAIVQKQEEHLEQLRGIRSEMLRKKMGLQTAKDQHGVEPFEFAALEELAKKHNLK